MLDISYMLAGDLLEGLGTKNEIRPMRKEAGEELIKILGVF